MEKIKNCDGYMRKLLSLFVVIIPFYLLNACTGSTGQPISSPVILSPTKIILPTTTPTIVFTPSPSATASPSPTITLTSTPITRLKYQCVDVLEMNVENLGFDGSLVFWGITDDQSLQQYLLDLKTGEKKSLGNIYDVVVSPDHNHLAYKTLDPAEVVITDEQGIPILQISEESIPVDLYWDNLERWLDNERLLIARQRYIPFEEDFKLSSLLVFNPFTGENTELFPESFPGIWELSSPAWRESNLSPDPTLSVVAYPGFVSKRTGIILWDIKMASEITFIETEFFYWFDFGYEPLWAPDGSQFVTVAQPRGVIEPKTFENYPTDAYVGGWELVRMSLDGKLDRITYLTNTYFADPSAPSWSPDGRKIAFWLTLMESSLVGEQLAIVDVDTGVVTNFCIPGYNSRYEGSSYSPVWSPDGNYLAVMIPDPDISHKKDVLIVNLKTDTAFKVIENAQVLGLGWLTAR